MDLYFYFEYHNILMQDFHLSNFISVAIALLQVKDVNTSKQNPKINCKKTWYTLRRLSYRKKHIIQLQPYSVCVHTTHRPLSDEQ